MVDIGILQGILQDYKFLYLERKWIAKRGRPTDPDKFPEIYSRYENADEKGDYNKRQFKEILSEIELRLQKTESEKRAKVEESQKNWVLHTHESFAKHLRKELKMEGTTWNTFKLEGRVKPQAVVQNACFEAVIKHNDNIPLNLKGSKQFPPLSKENVWVTFTKLLHDDEKDQFKEMQRQLSFNPDLEYDKLCSKLFLAAKIDDNDLNRAVLKHWISNVKRLIYGDPTLFDMCINFYGPQGTGKTTLSRFLTLGGTIPQGVQLKEGVSSGKRIGPLGEYAAEISFHDMMDVNFFAWASSYHALIISEPAGMGYYMDSKEVNQFKALLDRETFTTRVYYTQSTQKTPRTFSMMTSTNKHLYKLLADTTGQRRIFEFNMGSQKDGKTTSPDPVLYSFPYLELWKSVNEADSCLTPTHILWAKVTQTWESYRSNSTIEAFFMQSKQYSIPHKDEEVSPVEIDALYTAYDRWAKEGHYMPKNRGNFEDDLPLSGIVIENGKAQLVVKKSTRRGFLG